MAIGNNKNEPFKTCTKCRGKGKVRCPQCKGYGRPFDCGYCLKLSGGKEWGFVECPLCLDEKKIKRT